MSLAAQSVVDEGGVIDRLFAALSAGDLAAAQACCTPDVVIWHSFDQRPLDLDEVSQGWRDLIAHFSARAFVDVRREPIAGGFAQRHLMVVRTRDGARRAWPIAIFVTLRDGLIARLDEYMDRAGSYPAAENGQPTAPGHDA